MRMKAVYYSLVLLAVAGCSSVPKPSPYPFSSQQKMQAAEHWQVHASEVAEKVAAGGTREPVYIHHDDRSPFDQAFHGFLITELWNRGISVSYNPQETPLHINWDVQRVDHQAHRSNPSLPLGWLTGTIAVVTASPFVDVSPAFGTEPLPHCEVIITTQLTNTKTGEVPVRDSDVYYINDQDWQHYWPRPDIIVQKVYNVVDR